MFAGIASALGVIAFWGVTPTLVKIALRYVDPYTLSSLRLLQGLALVMLVHLKNRGGMKRLFRFNRWLLLGSIGITVNYILFIVALNYTTASTGGLLVQIQFVTLVILAWLVIKETFHILKLIGVLVIVAGVGLVFVQRVDFSEIINSEYTLGNALMLVAGLGWGVYALANKALSTSRSGTEILIPMFAFAAAVSIFTAIPGYEARSPMKAGGVMAIIILGTGVTGVGFILLTQALKRINASLVGAVTALSPLINILVSNKVLGERISPLLIAGGFLIFTGVTGIALTERKGIRKKESGTEILPG